MHNRLRGHRSRELDSFIDPDTYFTTPTRSSPSQRKQSQLRTAILHVLHSVIACDVDDPVLNHLALVDVVAEPNGTFTALFSCAATHAHTNPQQRLQSAAPLFRRAMAQQLTRKRVPQVSLWVVPAPGGDE
jgi:ribosome-binding factor A